MKARILSAACAVVIVASAFAAAYLLPKGRALLGASTNVSNVAKTSSTAAVSAGPVSTLSAGYTVKAYNGKIAVFIGDSTIPEEVLDVQLDTLPEDEKARLEAGIHVDTHDELLTLLENYTS